MNNSLTYTSKQIIEPVYYTEELQWIWLSKSFYFHFTQILSAVDRMFCCLFVFVFLCVFLFLEKMISHHSLERTSSPGQCCTVVRVFACTPKGLGFNAQARAHTWVASLIPSLSRSTCGRQPINCLSPQCFSFSSCLSPSFRPSLSFTL